MLCYGVWGGGFAILFGMFLTMWHGLNQKMDAMDGKFESKFSDMDKKIESKFSDMDKKFESKFDALDKKIDDKINVLQVKIENDMTRLETTLTIKIDKLDEKVTDMDRRLCRLEGAFSVKDCCAIKDDRHLRKAE